MDNSNGANGSQNNGSPAEQPVTSPVNEPVEQTTSSPMSQPADQPTSSLMSQPAEQPVGTLTKGEAKKKSFINVGCIVGGLILCGVIVALILMFTNKGSGKIVSCTQEQSTMGIKMKAAIDIEAMDGGIKEVKMDATFDFASISGYYENNTSALIESFVDGLKSRCDDDCEFSYTSDEGDKVTVTMKSASGNFLGNYGNLEGLSAQEVADKIQRALDGEDGTTCKQR